MSIRVVSAPPASVRHPHLPCHREPLAPTPFVSLPVGAVAPGGWVRRQVELQADGFIGHLDELSAFLRKENNAWLSPDGEGHSPWEELPYWLKGFGDTGYVLGDARIIGEARGWIEAALASQRDDGWFGPRANLSSGRGRAEGRGRPDLWPNMVMLFALQSYHEYTGDPRVLDCMTRYFRWQLALPDEEFLPPYWQQQRGADNLYSVHWLYNRTGEARLLELAAKIHRNTANWTEGVPNWHNVNIAQAFGGPATFYPQSGDRTHLEAAERNWQEVRRRYGQVPGGMFGGDENCREGYAGPRQAIETCGMVEEMLSDATLLMISGQAVWADRCEDVTFNSLPAALTADHKALRYLTAPNQVLSDRSDKAPGVQNGGPMFHMNPHGHRCCQHNMGHGWPYYAEHLWMATSDGGLAPVLYGPSTVTAPVRDGTVVRIAEDTRYPFDETITFTIETPVATAFPLYLRVPGWCRRASLRIHGEDVPVEARPGQFVVIEKTWENREQVVWRLEMGTTVRHWEANHGCVSVDRGPLTFSLQIGEQYRREGGTDAWPAWEIHPTTPWNYGLDLPDAAPASAIEVVRGPWPADDQPFVARGGPIALRAPARRIPEWQADHQGLVGPMQPCPARTSEPVETVTLVPMGGARLRVSAFPTVTDGAGGHAWAKPAPLSATASHCWHGDSIYAIADGRIPASSDDHTIPRHTWWDHRGTQEWLEWRFDEPTRVTAAEIYWFDDTGSGQCRVPASWRLLYRESDEAGWVPVPAAAPGGVDRDTFNSVTFDPLTVTGLRVEVQLRDGFSGGVLEWRVR